MKKQVLEKQFVMAQRMNMSHRDMLEWIKNNYTVSGNIYQEIEMSSTYVDMHSDINYELENVQLHSHLYYEVIFCVSGHIEYLIETRRYRIHPGDLIIVPPSVSHRPLLPAKMDEPYNRYIMWLSMDYVRLFQKKYPDCNFLQHESKILRLNADSKQKLLTIFDQGTRESSAKKIGWQAMLESSALQVFVLLKRLSVADTSLHLAEKEELFDRIVIYIDQNLASPISLESAANALFLSPSTIGKAFRNKSGTSFYRFVTQRRLNAAKSLILDGIDLKNVAPQVGFQDYSAFFKAFRAEYGVSPSEYRLVYQLTTEAS